MFQRKWANAVWLVVYLCLMAGLIGYLLFLRSDYIATRSSPESQAEWEAWRAQAAAAKGGPVQRRPPSSTEPPGLVLMRDYFAVVLAAAFVFGTAVFLMSMVAFRGVFSPSPEPRDMWPDKPPSEFNDDGPKKAG